jgi:GTP pyrophosphokinase
MPSTEEINLLQAISTYLPPLDVEHVRRTLDYARALRDTEHLVSRAAGPVQRGGNSRKSERMDKLEKSGKADPAKATYLQQDPGYVIGVAQPLADAIHIDAISLAAVLLYQAVESKQVTQDEIRQGLGGEFGEAVAQTLANIELFDTLQRPGETLRRERSSATGGSNDAARSRTRERQRQQDTENLRKMFVGMTEDPRVAVFKIADQLRLMRSIREAADYWHRGTSSHADAEATDGPRVRATPPSWTADECRLAAKETRDIYAPLAGRLGMGHVESELDDLAFAVLEPDDYAWLSAEVTSYIQERGSYVERVCDILRKEMRSIGLTAEISGRVKHLASIYRKVQRLGNHDLASLYDILAFRIIVPTTADCYMALGHVHALWKPMDGRIKDFIANPKSNGYQSLHTTVFCLDDRLAEIQIRTRQMHEQAEYGVAMHWYYKDVGDSASAQAKTLQDWVLQAKEWQQELQAAGPGNAEYALESVRDNVLSKEQIFVFTPAGDVKELPAGATPLDFAYLVHTDVGNHVAGVRILTTDSNGRLVKKLVPLDYELKNGEVVEIIKRKDAHPTRDWLRVARTKSARDKIGRYLKAHERDIDLQIGRERLDRELRSIGIRKGFEELNDEDLDWLVSAFVQPDLDSLLVAIGSDKLRLSKVMEKVRERLLPPPAADTDAALDASAEAEIDEAEQIGASVGGLSGLLTRLATCCNPLPTDELLGYVTRGRGVVIHRADCANLAHLISKEPGRAVPVEWPRKLGGHEHFRASVVVEARDRTGLLADVTGVITNRKINMIRQTTATKANKATITAVLEITRPEQLGEVLEALREVPSVLSAERRRSNQQETQSRNHGTPSR